MTTDGPDGCPDDRFGYLRSRTPFEPGFALRLDESYRLAHLPLVAPEHPGVIERQDGKFYESGRHPAVHSLVIPVPYAALAASEAYRELDAELRAASFAPKLAWDIEMRRRDRLHATLCGSLAVDPAPPPLLTGEQRDALRRGPIRIELRGLFSGNVNLGRLYLRAYPECRDGLNPLQAIQSLLGRPRTDLYLVGLHNLTDHLDAAETAELAALIERWWDRVILRFDLASFWLLRSRDDLVLDSEITEELPLSPLPSTARAGTLSPVGKG